MKVSEMFPSRFATAADLGGKAVMATISKIAMEKMHPQGGGPAVEKPVLYVRGGTKGIVLSKALAFSVADALGNDDTEAWPGRRVVLHPVDMVVAGRPCTAIRARRAVEDTLEEAPTELQDPEGDT